MMHKKNAVLWVVVAGLLVACPSLFCWGMGFGIFLGNAGYGTNPETEQISLVWGVLMVAFGMLFWLLPLGVGRYASRRPAPAPKQPEDHTEDNATEQPYSPFSSDPYHDADASMQNMDSDF